MSIPQYEPGIADPASTPGDGGAAREALLDQIAAQVVRRGLVTPAVFFIELHRPLGFLAGQATHLLTPFLGALFGLRTVRQFAELLEEPGSVDALLDRIERLERERAAEER